MIKESENNSRGNDSETIRNALADSCIINNNNNNNFLSINNNSIEKNYSADLNGGGSVAADKPPIKNCGEFLVNKECVNMRNGKCNTSDVTIKVIDSMDNDCDGDAQSMKSNASTDIDVEIQDKDSRKSVGTAGTILLSDEINWPSTPNKLVKEAAMNYGHHDGDTANRQPYDVNGLNMISSNLKKEVSIKNNFIGNMYRLRESHNNSSAHSNSLIIYFIGRLLRFAWFRVAEQYIGHITTLSYR